MYVTPLSPQIEGSLASIETFRIKYLQMLDAAILADFLQEKLVQGLLDKQKLLVVLPEDISVDITSSILSAHDLDALCLPMKFGIIDDTQINRLRLLKDIKLRPSPHSALSLNLGLIRDTLEQIKGIIQAAYTQNSDELSIANIVNGIIEKWQKLSTINQLALSRLKIDSQNLSSIDALEKLYDPHFRVLDNAVKLNPSIFSSVHGTQEALLKLRELKASISPTLRELNETLGQKKKEIKRQFLAECRKWEKTVSDIQHLYKAYQLGDNRSFVEMVSPLLYHHSTDQYVKPDIVINNTLNWGQTKDVLDKINAVIGTPQARIDEEYHKYYLRLTPYNSTLPMLNTIVEKSAELLATLNATHFFKVQLPTRFFQIFDVEAKLKQALELCTLGEMALSNKSYCQYRVICQELNVDQEIIDQLSEASDYSWREIIDNCFLQIKLEDFFPSRLSELPKLIYAYEQALKNNTEIALTEVTYRWSHIRELATSSLKNENWDLFQQLFENQSRPIELDELVSDEAMFLSSYFPIWTLKESDLHHLAPNFDLFDEVIFLNTREWSQTAVDLMVGTELNITIATTHEYPRLPEGTKRIFSTEVQYDPLSPLQQLNRTERYREGLSLASMLIDTANSFSVYQWRNVCVLSFMGSRFNKTFEANYEADGLNGMYKDSTDIADLVEALIIENTDVVFLLPEGLLNIMDLNSLEYQLFVIDRCKKADIAMISIGLEDLYFHRESTIENVALNIKERHLYAQKSNKNVEVDITERVNRTVELALS